MNAQKPNVVYVVTNEAITGNILAQVTRDLMVLNAEFGVAVFDPDERVPTSMLNSINIERTTDEPVLQLVYKAGDKWPTYDPDLEHVLRDLKPEGLDIVVDGRGLPGYYLKPQGRDGPNRTELMLNRAYPRGSGASSMVNYLWG